MVYRTSLIATICALPIIMRVVAALPEAAFPFNSQVPTVARVAEPYKFQIAAATFTEDSNADLSYTLVDGPAWLNLDTQTRTLYGMPGQGNSGVNTFTITAANDVGSTSMDCTLVVTDNTAPRIAGNVSAILAKSGTITGPTSLSLQPNNAFTIEFGKNFFQAGTGSIQAYYAILSDHTPLPSWLEFQHPSLAFWGIAPGLSGVPQSWTINLVATDVVGFSGVVASFTLAISANQFAFRSQHEDLIAVPKTPLTHKSLLDDLSLNGESVTRSQIQSAFIQAPSWLVLQNDTLYLEGTPPAQFKAQDVIVTVINTSGDIATKTLYLRGQNVSLFAGEVGKLTATAGKPFIYTIKQSIFSQLDTSVTIGLGVAGSWLRYDADTLQLKGTPPVHLKSQTVSMSITASSRALSMKESQYFELQIQAAPLGVIPTTSNDGSISTTTRESSTGTSTTTPLGEPIINASSNHRSTKVGVVVGVVIGCFAVVALLAAMAILLCRRTRRDQPPKSEKPTISKPKPLLPSEEATIPWPLHATTQETRDLESGMMVHDQPPHLDLPPLPSSTFDVAQSRYRRSLASSMGDGEAAIQADPNIPVWGRKSNTVHTPHDSYSAATELARVNSMASQNRLSQFTKLSPRKRTSKLLHSWHSPQKRGSRPLLEGGNLPPGGRRSRISSGLSVTRDRSSAGSFNTHGTSLLSARALDFPEPPQLNHRRTRSIPKLSFHGIDNRLSIRLVSRSDSTATDDRPLAEKRQSFIRNRASSSIVSPLFASSRRTSHPLEHTLTHGSSLHRARSQRTFFSASSSLEPQNPPTRNPRRMASQSNSFTPSLHRPNSSFPSRTASPSRVKPADATIHETDVDNDDDENTDDYTTTPNPTTSSSSTDHLRDAAFAAHLAQPRHARNWVLPGEASPTPPPSAASRNREAARRKWAHKLKRDSRGNPVAREVSPVRLTDVAQKIVRLKREGVGEGGEGSARGGDRLSMLVAKDSINGAMRKRARVEEEEGRGRAQVVAGAEEGESEWEDVLSNRDSRTGSVVAGRDLGSDASKSTFGGKAFV